MKSIITTPAQVKNYPGSKGTSGHLQHIVSLIPKCDTFIEAMAGSAVISNYIAGKVNLIVTNDYDASLPIPYHLHYMDLIAEFDYGGSGHVVFYFDPPYLMSTRSYKGKLYRHEWSTNDHIQFLSAATVVKSNCMISHYPCPMYNDALSSWRKYNYKAMTRAGIRTECIYMNFKEPELLTCCSVVGNNHTHRQQVKRKLQRLIAKINKLPIQERQAIVTAINQSYVSHRQ